MATLPVSKITDHAERAANTLPSFQYLKPNVAGFARIVGNRAQTIEDVLWDILTLTNLEAGTGALIDLIGAVVGEPRLGRSDADYVDAIDVRILVNTSEGDIERMIAVAKRYAKADSIILDEYFPAAMTIRVFDGTYNPTGLARALQDAKAAGVRLFVEVTTDGEFAVSTLLLQATDGATAASPNPTDLFDSATADFIVKGTAIGNWLRIYNPDGDAGLYPILAVLSATRIQVDGALAASKAGATFDVRRNDADSGGMASVVSAGADGATAGSPDPTDAFTSASATFLSDGVTAGMYLVVAGEGEFEIDSVPSETSIVLTTAALPASLSGKSYAVLDVTDAGTMGYLI